MPYNPDDLMVQCEGCKDWYDNLLSQNYIIFDKEEERIPCLKVETFRANNEFIIEENSTSTSTNVQI